VRADGLSNYSLHRQYLNLFSRHALFSREPCRLPDMASTLFAGDIQHPSPLPCTLHRAATLLDQTGCRCVV
jgi:hypothetical protein